ncbi:putative disease resistance protein RGA4 [Drosera capensis]
MAEAILHPIASQVLKFLGSQAVEALALVWGFKSELVRLESTVKTIKLVLLDAEDRQVEQRSVTDWLKRLKVVLYEVEDLFEDVVATSFSWEEKRSVGKVKLFFSRSNKVYQAHKMARKIKEIRKKLDDIDTDSHRYTFRVFPVDAPVRRRRDDDTHSFINKTDVIGRDDDKQIIMNMLFASNAVEQNVTVIPIVGMGGLGKTALAQLVYNDVIVRGRFDMRLWVCVTDKFDLKEIIQKILMSATRTESGNIALDQLQCHLQEKIEGNRCLLVLDDVWNESRDEWLKLKCILDVCGKGSKILVTTRLWSAAEVMVDGFPPHELKGLSAEKSWSLFEKMAFMHGQERSIRLVELGQGIVKKCGGVPLAIRTLGSFLYGQPQEKWASVKDKELSQIGGQVDKTMEVLKFSYHHLDSPLKQCFAYCSLFPKNTVMKKNTLIWLWMAQGFLSSEYQSLEETGEVYFAELRQRGFFQDVERELLVGRFQGDGSFGCNVSCKMHGLVHDLAQQISGAEAVSAIDGRANFNEGICHVSFYFVSDVTTSFLSLNSLRTLFIHNDALSLHLDGSFKLSSLLSRLGCLRVLHLGYVVIQKMPESVGKLVHLRYLAFSGSPFRTLPDSFGDLLNLQTLRLNRNYFAVLPTVIRRLTSLRHLVLKRSVRLTEVDISSFTSLRHLDLSECLGLTHIVGDISSLINLRHLDLSGCRSLRCIDGDISNLTNLRYMDLRRCVGMTQPPSGIEKLTELKFLHSKDWAYPTSSSYWFNMKDLMRASAEVLGRGSKGMTFKAVLEEGMTVVVKRLKGVTAARKEFEVAVEKLGKLDHDNLVALRKYHYSTDEKLLVFDYIPGGSLSALLHDNSGSDKTPRGLATRVKVSLAAARGISYLHESVNIVHGNIKASNILLRDSSSAATVCGFGLNGLFGGPNVTDRATGYEAPELYYSHKGCVTLWLVTN